MAFDEDVKRFTNAELTFNQPLKNRCTYKTGGDCDFFIEVNSVLDLKTVIELLNGYNIDFYILGGGSNVLFSDSGFRGAIISLKNLNSVTVENNIITAYTGASINSVVKKSVDCGLTGLEGLYGIPGTIGGGVIMNASAFNYCLSDNLYTVTTLKGDKIKKYFKEDCNFYYRHSVFQERNEIVVSASFLLKNGDKERSVLAVKNFLKKRWLSQPQGLSAGSVFVNPVGDYSARLIECANLKGFRIGGATVSKKHANFILADAGAKSIDIFRLIQYVKNTVKEKFGITLKEEIKFVGDFNGFNG